MKSYKDLVLFFPVLLLLSCGVKPEPIVFGKDFCTYCKMSIVDPKFGAELVTTKGKVFKFDALECMVPFKKTQASEDWAYTLGIAYDQPEQLVPVDSLQFVVSDKYNSPMGANLAGFKTLDPQDGDQKIYDWSRLQEHLSKSE